MEEHEPMRDKPVQTVAETTPPANPPTRALPPQAISLSCNVSAEEAQELSAKLLKHQNYSKAIVMSLDIRESTTVMLHVDDFDKYATTLSNFIGFVWKTVTDAKCWFDKFTGDGALIFLPIENDLTAESVGKMVKLAIYLQRNFINFTIPWLRLAAGCIPENFGLAIGIDYGQCLITNLRCVDLKIDAQSVSWESQSITILGRAVVGAVRMSSAANAHQILLNELPGSLIHRYWGVDTPTSTPTSIRRMTIQNKDIRRGQFAYEAKCEEIEIDLRLKFNPEVVRQTVQG